MEPTRGVDEYDVRRTRDASFDAVEHDRRRVRASPLADQLAPDRYRPDAELARWRRHGSVPCDEEDPASRPRMQRGELCRRWSSSHSVTPSTRTTTGGPRAKAIVAREHRLISSRAPPQTAPRSASASDARLHARDQLRRRPTPHVRRDEGFLELGQRRRDLAPGTRKRGIELAAEALPGRGQRVPEPLSRRRPGGDRDERPVLKPTDDERRDDQREHHEGARQPENQRSVPSRRPRPLLRLLGRRAQAAETTLDTPACSMVMP